MPFAQYMHTCLYEDGLGYYVNGLSTIGSDGDFVTAPEMSGRFATCLARQADELFRSDDFRSGNGNKACVNILEFGAGTGRLACDILKALDQLGSLPDQYLILDVSGQLMAAQQWLMNKELSPDLMNRVQWVQKLPAQFEGLVVANEVFDAFPVERFTMDQSQPMRVYVDYQDSRFVTVAKPDAQVQEAVSSLQVDLQQEFSTGFTSEYCPLLQPWWLALSDVLHRGLVLVCDYGSDQASYYAPSKSSGTLRCFFRHSVHDDPLAYAGVQDITADVDFTALTQASIDAGFELEGYTPMSQFMLGNKVLQDHQQAISDQSELEQIAATGNLKQLLLPQEMGERFMVAGYSRGLQSPLSGFSLADWSRLL